MRKTLADLKRDAKSGKLKAEVISYYGGTNIPQRLKGVRPIVDSNTVAIFFLNKDGEKSALHVEKASLVDYTGDTLTIYAPGKRPLNKYERGVMNEWKRITETDTNFTYWKKKSFFREKGYEYLMGFEKQRGMKYDHNSGMVLDDRIKGDIILQYRIYRDDIVD